MFSCLLDLFLPIPTGSAIKGGAAWSSYYTFSLLLPLNCQKIENLSLSSGGQSERRAPEPERTNCSPNLQKVVSKE